MEILFVTSEVAPYSKIGGLADVSSALPKALRGLGHRVTVLSPLYSDIDPTSRSLARRLMRIEVDLAGQKVGCEIYDGRTAAGVDLLFVGHEQYFRRVPYVYGSGDDAKLDAVRFALLSKAAAEIAKVRDPRVQVIHAHDWPAALTPVVVRRTQGLETVATVLTIHNIAHQGFFERDVFDQLDLPPELFSSDSLEYFGRMNLLKGGILAADRVTTVSPSYAKEIALEEHGHGLDAVVRSIGTKLSSILNGVDTAVWNPATDAAIPARFDPFDSRGKDRCKLVLQEQLGLPVRGDVPLFGSVGRVVPQKGYDLLAKAAAALVRNDVQLVVLGSGDETVLSALADLSRRYPDRVQVRSSQDEGLAHRIFAGSDFVVVPSRFEPCGLTQMYAHRYGALPVARRTGGLADTIVDCDASLGSGNGFLYEAATPDALLSALQRAVSAFALREALIKARARAMRVDHSWERSARLYERVYAAAIETRQS